MPADPRPLIVGNQRIAVPGHYLDACLTNQQGALRSAVAAVRQLAPDFHALDLTSDDNRALMAILSLYDEAGYTEQQFRVGVSLTLYQLCKRMHFPPDQKGRFGGKARQAALQALFHLSKKTFDVYFPKFLRREKGQNIYHVIVHPHCSVLDIVYEASNVTEAELVQGRIKGKATTIHVRVKWFFFNRSYYRLFRTDFYPKLHAVLAPQRRRVSKYHWALAMWLLRQNHRQPPLEINVDKLLVILKLPNDSAHRSRGREMVRQLYADFEHAGFLASYRTAVSAQNGHTKDVLLPGDLG